jgi:hypothetical protein
MSPELMHESGVGSCQGKGFEHGAGTVFEGVEFAETVFAG